MGRKLEQIYFHQAHEKKCSTSLVIRKMQVRTTRKYHFIPVRMALIKKTTITNGEDVEKRGLSYTVDGNVNLCSNCVRQSLTSSKNYRSII